MTQPHTTVSLSVIGKIAIPVKDLNRAVAFYRDSLGMKFLFQSPPVLAFFDCSGVWVMLDVPENKEFAHPSSPIYFKVADIQATAKAMKGKDVQFRQEPNSHRQDARPHAVDGVLL